MSVVVCNVVVLQDRRVSDVFRVRVKLWRDVRSQKLLVVRKERRDYLLVCDCVDLVEFVLDLLVAAVRV